jgi:signal transduction histidine kinase
MEGKKPQTARPEEQDEERRRLLTEHHYRRRRVDAQQHMARRIAHDFNNLLQPVLGYIHLARNTDDPEKARGFLGRAVDGGEKARKLIEQIVGIGHGSPGRLTVFMLNDAVAAAVARFRTALPEGIHLEVDHENQHMLVRGNVDRLDEMLTHLFTNACEAMTDGGTLRVGVGRRVVESEESKDYPLLATGEYAIVTVVDDGVGMSPDTEERIFDPFFSTKLTGVGRGLGLTTAYDVVTELGGDIDVASEPGCGTCVRVCIPLSTEPPAP